MALVLLNALLKLRQQKPAVALLLCLLLLLLQTEAAQQQQATATTQKIPAQEQPSDINSPIINGNNKTTRQHQQPLKPIIVASSVNQSALTRMIESRLAKAYLALGFQLKVQYLPAGRSLLMSNKGEFDGELFRIQSVASHYPNLRLVPVPLTSVELYAFVRPAFVADSQQWQQNAKLRIGYVRGFKMAEQYLFKGSRVPVTTTRQAIRMLNQGKVDLVLDDVESVLQVQQDLTGTEIRRLPQVLSSDKLFHFVHKKHQALLEPLTAELQKTATTVSAHPH